MTIAKFEDLTEYEQKRVCRRANEGKTRIVEMRDQIVRLPRQICIHFLCAGNHTGSCDNTRVVRLNIADFLDYNLSRRISCEKCNHQTMSIQHIGGDIFGNQSTLIKDKKINKGVIDYWID